MRSSFNHFDAQGRVHMVDVSGKPNTVREAVAQAIVEMAAETRQRIDDGQLGKGDVLSVAELAGVMGAKQTSTLIPLCHPIALTHVSIRCTWLTPMEAARASLSIESTARTTGPTGVEMEALTACSTAALTVYDMCKAVDRAMVIQQIRLLKKTGGKSGTFRVEDL